MTKLRIVVLSVIVLFAVSGAYCVYQIHSSEKYTVRLCRVERGWGYDILRNNKPFIHQETIPALLGNQSFKTCKSAEIAAKMVVKKLKNDQSPSLSQKEVIKIIKIYQ